MRALYSKMTAVQNHCGTKDGAWLRKTFIKFLLNSFLLQLNLVRINFFFQTSPPPERHWTACAWTKARSRSKKSEERCAHVSTKKESRTAKWLCTF